MHTLKIELNNTHNFYKVTCPEGDYITSYNSDTDDPKSYYGCKEMYVPLVLTEEDIREKYHCIIEAEHLEYERLKEESFMKEEEENRKKMMEFKPEKEEDSVETEK